MRTRSILVKEENKMSKKIISIAPLGFPWETQDPFLFCAYHRDLYPEGNTNMGVDKSALKGRYVGQDFVVRDGWRMYHGRTIPGFPYHPHRGFETITINKEGVVDHTDSLGAAGRFMDGDVQWMTAGKGVQHSEMFPLLNEDKPNHLEIFQIWLNLPAASKFVEPHFKMLWKEDLPVIKETNEAGKTVTVDLIAGNLSDKKALEPTPDSWAANDKNKVRVLTVVMEPGTTWTLPATEEGINRSIYFYSGDELKVDGTNLLNDHMANLMPQEDVLFENKAEVSAKMLILEGKPIGEPVAKHGPFVMNTYEEIEQAVRDYQRTQFGGWPWKVTEKVHDKNKGRFALHADGREELKNDD